jgi:acyl carrier protein
MELDQNIRVKQVIDSFHTLQFLVSLNERLGIDIPGADYERLPH